MWAKEMFGTDVYHIVHWFLIYSILGWIVESIYMSICSQKLVNRGFAKGPYCPIYGVGALTVYFLLRPFREDYLLLYVSGCIIATSLEYITARITQFICGEVWWDYKDKPYNYKGILCLESSIAWGFYTLFLFLFLHKAIQWLVNRYSLQAGTLLGCFMLMVFTIDFIHSLYMAKRDVLPDNLEEFKESIRGFYQR
jgi:uncharacterized membrane protein